LDDDDDDDDVVVVGVSIKQIKFEVYNTFVV